ncbi:MAG: hypothetical protein RLZZ179_3271 [Verrucomicrobiota bacterium]
MRNSFPDYFKQYDMKNDVTELFRKLRWFQIQSSQRFAEFHVDMGLPLGQEATESSEMFEEAINNVASIRMRYMAAERFKVRFVECEILEAAEDSLWLYEDVGLMTGLQGFSWGMKRSLGNAIYRYHGFYDLDSLIPRPFSYVKLELRKTASVATDVFVYVPFEHVKFYLNVDK